jgi:hypothetical protein
MLSTGFEFCLVSLNLMATFLNDMNECYLLRYDFLSCGGSLSTFQRNVRRSSSGSKCEPNTLATKTEEQAEIFSYSSTENGGGTFPRNIGKLLLDTRYPMPYSDTHQGHRCETLMPRRL